MLLKVSVLFIYVFIPVTKFCEGKGDINASYSQLATTWTRAKEQCIPFGSKTTFNVSNDKVIVNSTSNEAFWIGAYAEYTKWTKILGCYKVTTVVSASGVNNTALEIHDVKSCLEYCAGFTYFGLTNDRCICYGDSFTLSNIGRCLPQRCSGSGQDFCGGPGEAIVYQRVPDQFSGVGECLASGYRGEYNYTGAQFHLFNQAVVLPCDNKELGYIYRTVLGFPQSHHLFVYTLPVDSWQNAVLGSYQTAVGILEFVNFLLAKQSLSTPIVGDKYWVGLFRRHQVKFGSELPLSGDVSCVAGKININGTMTTVLRSCTDQLRVLCEPNDGDVTVDATTSSTVTVQSENNNATKTNHKITNLGIESEQFLGTTVWYIVLGVLSFLLLVVIIITIAWSLNRLNKQKANIPVESTPNNYTDFRSMLERNTNRENATSSREELYLTIPEQEMAADRMENRPRLSLPERELSSEFHGARPFNENKYNEIEGEYSDIKDGNQSSSGSLSDELLSEANRADNETADGQYFLLEKNLNDFDQEKSNKASGVIADNDVGDLYYEVENVDTGLSTVIYHGLEKEGVNDPTNIDGDLGTPDVINNVYHELERPTETCKLNLSKKVSFSQNTTDLLNRNNLIYEKVWDNGYKQHKTKSMKTRTEGDDRQAHIKLKSSVSAPITKSTRPKKSLKLRKKDSERRNVIRNRVRISGLPEVSAPRNSTYDMLKHSTKVSGARAPEAGLEDYDTMASVRAFLEEPPSSCEN